MTRALDTSTALDEFVGTHPVAAVYFSSPDCQVCHVLKPKLRELLAARFPRLAWAEVDCAAHPEPAAQQQVFAVPTLVIYFDGHEAIRKSRNIAPAALVAEMERPYGLFVAE